MASLTPGPSSAAAASYFSSSSTPVWKHDVFLSFRGEDTGKSFTDHLYSALKQKGISTFRDEETLERGKTIAPDLLKAIEESRFAIVIFSKNYAFSTWCLEEVSKIAECKKGTGQMVFPIFYDVDPSEVRKQTGPFGEAFAKHEDVFKDNIEGKVRKWRQALSEIANVSGWDLRQRQESVVIDEVVETIFKLLNSSFSSSAVDRGLVGMDSRMVKMLSYLEMSLSNDVRTVGISGVGGIGKTTLAQEVFTKFGYQFEASCFLANVREESEKHGLRHLQKDLHQFLLGSKAKIQYVGMGINILRERLRYKKVLIILDDVDDLEQLEALAGNGNFGGKGSRIIVTTRDKHLLKKFGENNVYVYEIDTLSQEEALRLFSKKAFKKNHPANEYKEKSKEVVKYANGLPLALKVLGSFLFERSEEEWSSTLARLKELGQQIWMHDLQELGQQIVRGESPEEPGKRSRLSLHKDARKVLEENSGTKAVEGIFRISPKKEVQLDVDEYPLASEKKVFLDISCFFKGEDECRVKKISEISDCYPGTNIKVLTEKSLGTIARDKIRLHDLLQELGQQIVHGESLVTTDENSLVSSSSSTPLWTFDVFLSFRGEDTRTSFTDHLYDALDRKGIHTFRDDVNLEKGETITPELLKAIEESRFSIVIISRNYAFSTWCLDEILKIVECKKVKGQTVFPIFYQVEPSEVRKQTGAFGEAFARHEQVYKDDVGKVKRWREALTEICSVSGWHLKQRHESGFINEIVEKILSMSNRTSSSVNKHLVGMDFRIKKMLSYLDLERSNDVRTIGIWGMGGIGKTTLAQEIFKKIRHKFESWCFVSRVRVESEKSTSLVQLQKYLYNSLLGSDANIQNDNMGIDILSARLCCKKVLIILDDVDQLKQIETLVGKSAEQHNWFGPGSRIIVTTRDSHLLKTFGENNIYEVDKLSEKEALHLFCRKAFKKDHPADGYKEKSNDFVNYANGLPLALEELGSFLYGRKIDEWSSTLASRKEHPGKNIVVALQVSFDGLEDTEKKMFLDIACFFKGEEKCRVKRILGNRDYSPDSDIEVLTEKSLVTVVEGKLLMHDLPQELGRNIVRRDFPEEPGKRSRLWLPQDVLNVLQRNKVTEAVESILLYLPETKELHLNADPFSKMCKLRLLKIRNVKVTGCIGYLSEELRLLEWHGYPLKSLPSSFQPNKLVELNLSNSRIEQIWGANRLSQSLVLIDLSNCQYLIKTPNFNTTPNLERLILRGCKRLQEIHPSIGVLKRLDLLNLKGCSRLDNLPENLGSLERLQELNASWTAIRKLPSSISLLKNLKHLSFRGCNGIQQKSLLVLLFSFFFRSKSSESSYLQFPNSLAGLISLKSLDLSKCSLREEAIPDDLWLLSSLERLDLSENNFRSIPDGICQLSELRELCLDGCSKLQSLPNIPSSVNLLNARNCAILETSNDYKDDIYRGQQNVANLARDLFLANPVQDYVNQCQQIVNVKKLTHVDKVESIIEDQRIIDMIKSVEQKQKGTLREPSVEADQDFTSPNRFSLRLEAHNSGDTSSIAKQGCKTYSLMKLRRELQSLLLRFLQNFDQNSISCSTPTEFLEFSWYHNRGPSVKIELPTNILGDGNWVGLALCAYFSELDYQNTRTSIDNEENPCHFVCLLETERGTLDRRVYKTTNEEFRWLQHEGQFIWLSYIPRVWFLDQLNECSAVEASFESDHASLYVEKCGLCLLFRHDEDEFKQTIAHCMNSFVRK